MAAGVWFRKCLRLDDNAALVAACASKEVVPFYILDPKFADPNYCGVNRYNFLLQSLSDLDSQLRAKGSRLVVLRGSPDAVLKNIFAGRGPFKLAKLFWEVDTEPYARVRDAAIVTLAKDNKVEVQQFSGHTFLDIEKTVNLPGFKPPTQMSMVEKLVFNGGAIKQPLPVPKIPALKIQGHDVPKISEFFKEAPTAKDFPGGEREALKRLDAEVTKSPDAMCKFEKPKTASTGRPGNPLHPSTTGLSPYLKFGCVSVRRVYHAVIAAVKGKTHTQPPTSLIGQMFFREMFYLLGYSIPNFDKDVGNPHCKQIPWGNDKKLRDAWENGQTGYPFIDALMRQLKQTGHMHHLGRHAVACFLTRGDLWQHWTFGRDVFDKLLLDADWSLNNGNWLWLAGVAPFSAPYFRIYSPVPDKTSSLNAEQTGEFVKHFCPELKKMPEKFIYAPWTAPKNVQEAAGCVIGKNYPAPIVDHATARVANLEKFKNGLAALRGESGGAAPAKGAGKGGAKAAKAAPAKAAPAAGVKRASSSTAVTPAKKAKTAASPKKK